jgi:hypothetical protein
VAGAKEEQEAQEVSPDEGNAQSLRIQEKEEEERKGRQGRFKKCLMDLS